MNELLQILYPIGGILALIMAYIAHKKHWKIADIF